MKRFRLEADVPAVAGEGAPQWQLLFPLGATKFRPDFPKGRADFDEDFLGSLAANFEKMKARHKGDGFALQLNYLHPEPGQPVENHRAAGWIEGVELRDDGLWVLVKWTDEARARIEADEFRYLSPEFSFDAADTDTGKRQGPTLWGAALLNTPFLKELPRVAASDNLPETSGNGAPQMDKKAICAALGMPEDSTDEAVVEKCKALAAKLAELEAGAAAATATAAEAKAGEKTATVRFSEAQAAVLKLSAEKAELTERLVKFEAEKKASDVKTFFDEMVRTGRCSPSDRSMFEPMALKNGLEEWRPLEKRAPVVTMGEQGVAGTDAPESREAATRKLSAIADELKKKHGLSDTEAMRLALRQDKALADKASATTK